MTKTRFQRLPKKDRDEVQRIKAILDEELPSTPELINESISIIRHHVGTPRAGSTMASQFSRIQSHFYDHGIIRRLLDNDIDAQIVSLRTCARLGYLTRLAGGTSYSGGCDCLHIFDILPALAVREHEVLNRFLAQFQSPFKSGHQSTLLLANSVYAILNGDSTAFQALTPKLRNRKENRFFRAMYDSLLAIDARDGDALSAALSEMAKWNKRTDINSSMQKLVCIPAHAIYNLSLSAFTSEVLTPPLPINELPWDSEFHDGVQSEENSAGCFDFTNDSVVLGRWVTKLPDHIDANELVADC